jgi:nucleotide-binding universal stress UspA family protein
MTVAVAHQATATGHLALRAAAREAALRSTRLSVIQVTDSVDLDKIEAHKAGLSEDIARVLREENLGDLDWDLQLTPGQHIDDIANTILDLAGQADAELLVIGARRRSPVGKLFLGSLTQTLILHADIPVLVVKLPA